MLSLVAAALVVLLGGAAMTAAWVALYFPGDREPPARLAPTSAHPVRAPAKRLLWLVFDAMRSDAAFDARLMPNLARLRARGVWGIARTGSLTMTGLCVRTLGTGMEPRPTDILHNFRSPPIRADNFFRRVHRAGKRTLLVGDHIWTDLYRMTVRFTLPQPDRGIEDVRETDAAALRDAMRTLPKGWDVVVLHLVGSDHAAHRDKGVTGTYRKRLAYYDTLIPRLRRRMSRDGTGRDVTLAVMADHACNAHGNHGGGEVEATRAPYVLSGPGVLSLGRRDIDQRALAPTLAALLGVGAPWGAERVGLLDALALSPQERAWVAYDQAAGRLAYLEHFVGHRARSARARLALAERDCVAHRSSACRQQSEALVGWASRRKRASGRGAWFVWVAAVLLLLGVAWVLSQEPRRGWARAVLQIVLAGGAFAAVFLLPARLGALVGSLAVVGVALAGAVPDRLARGVRVVGAWVVLWATIWCALGFLVGLVGWFRGRPAGSVVWGAGLVPLAALAWAAHARKGWTRWLARGWRAGHASLALAAGAFLFLPWLRWWSWRHLALAAVGLLGAGAGLLWLRALAHRLGGRLGWRGVLGALSAMALSAAVILQAHPGTPERATWLLWATTLLAPPLVWFLGSSGHPSARLPWLAAGLGWLLALLPRVGLLSHPRELIVVVAALAVVVAALGARAPLVLLLIALLRLVWSDLAVGVSTLLAGAALAIGSISWRPRRQGAEVGFVLVLALLELLAFYGLGHELAFGRIDVTVGFVGGGGLNLKRIVALVVLSYAIPWWILMAGAAPVLGAERQARLLLVVLTVKTLGAFLVYLGHPAHFWLLHSLLPFLFFSVAQVLMVGVGGLLTWRVGPGVPGLEPSP